MGVIHFGPVAGRARLTWLQILQVILQVILLTCNVQERIPPAAPNNEEFLKAENKWPLTDTAT